MSPQMQERERQMILGALITANRLLAAILSVILMLAITSF